MLRIPQSCQDWACEWLDIRSFVAFCAMNTAAWRRYAEGRHGTYLTLTSQLSCATISVSGARLLLRRVRSRVPIDPWTVLCGACASGAIAAAQWVVDNCGIDIRMVRDNYDWLLRQTCYYGQFAVARWLVERYDIPLTAVRRPKCFVDACDKGHLPVVEWLAAEARCPYDHMALRIACTNGHLDIVQFLVRQFKLTRERVCADNYAPLRGACLNDRLDLVRWLVVRFNIPLHKLARDTAFKPATIHIVHGSAVAMWLYATRNQ